jgi:hypothetical protein
MHWLSRLESKFGHIAIHGLLRYVAAFSSLCFVLVKLNPHYLSFLYLDRDRLMAGEVWRLVTYLFIPSFGGLFFPDWLGMAMYVWFLFWMGDGLEQAWGAFRFNVFFFIGMLGTTAGALIANSDPGGGILQTTVFLAFARFYPETVIRLFFLLPVKVKWLAWLDGALLLMTFLGGNLSIRLAIIAGLLNYLLFFGRDIFPKPNCIARWRIAVRDLSVRFALARRRRCIAARFAAVRRCPRRSWNFASLATAKSIARSICRRRQRHRLKSDL